MTTLLRPVLCGAVDEFLSLTPLLCLCSASVSLTSRLVKTLLYNFIRQEKCPPPATHIFDQQSDGGGLLYGLASGVASKYKKVNTVVSYRYPVAVQGYTVLSAVHTRGRYFFLN